MGRSGRSRLGRLFAVVAGASLLVGVMASPAFAAAPIVTSFSPTSGPVGTAVTVNGDHFTGSTSVTFSNVSAGFTLNGDNQLTATVPSGFTSGTIKVTNVGGTGESAGVFTVTSGAPAPVITSFTPTSGPVGAQVTINGDHFTGTTVVRFGSASASFSVNTDDKITATVPTGATTGKISVTTPGGTIQSSGTFTVTIVSHDRSVTLSLPGRATASGQVFVNDGYEPCRSLVPVVIKRFVHGRWRWVATTATRPDGTYRAFIRHRPGSVRARALRLELANGAICRAVRSPEVRP